VAYECVLPPLSSDEREAYYAESKTMAALFGIPQNVLPANWLEFEAYCRGMNESVALGVNDLSREMAHRVLQGKGTWVPVPGWYRALTSAWMPKRLREEFGLPFDRREQDAAAGARRWLPRIYGRLPATVRFTGPYLEAMSRVRGRGVTALTRASNRFWMGQPRMMFAERGSGDAVELPQPLQ
jgi:uncharacterized protein (DUF2236 family)